MSDVEQLPLASYLPTFQILQEADIRFILVAGQAVNLWASHFQPKEPALNHFLPFVSKDVDLFGSPQDLDKLTKVLSGTLVRFRDVRQPIIGTFTTDSEPSLKIEILRGVHGPISNKKILTRAQHPGPIHVIDPISLLAAKCHNVTGIDQENRQDERHVRMMVLVSHAYFRDILAEVNQAITERQFINELRYLLDFHDHHDMRVGLTQAGHTVADCLPLRELHSTNGKFPKINHFVENTLQPKIELST